MCWGDSGPGTVVQMCPGYFADFDPSGEASAHTHTKADVYYVLYFIRVFMYRCSLVLTSPDKSSLFSVPFQQNKQNVIFCF